MAYTKMTFTLPELLARRFTRSIPARLRSQYIAQALDAKLAEHEQRLIAACEVANEDPDLQALEHEFDSLPGEISEPWTARGSTSDTAPG